MDKKSQWNVFIIELNCHSSWKACSKINWIVKRKGYQHPTNTCPKSTTEKLEQGVKYAHS